MSLYVIGVDPGLTTGIVGLPYRDDEHRIQPSVIQCDHGNVLPIVADLVHTYRADFDLVLAVESFVTGGRSTRLANAEDGRITRELVANLVFEFERQVQRVHVHPAAVVKPWATNTRIEAAGLLGPTASMQHARDAARHALYVATHDHGVSDPLSKKAR